MNYVFCGAYKALLFALYFKSLGEKTTVVTYNKDIIKYCTAENIDYIKFDFIRPKITSISKVFALKKTLDETLEKIDMENGDRFFLSGLAKGYDFFYLAKELSKKGVGYYKHTEGKVKKFKPPRFKPIFIRGGIMRLMLKLVMNLDLMYYRADIKSPYFGIDDEFLKKYNIVEFAPDTDIEELILEAIKKSKINYKEYDNFIIDKGPLSDYIKFDSIKRLHEKLFELPLDTAFKKHPSPIIQKDHSEAEFYEPFNRCDEIPRYIPAELFFNNVRKNVISLCSVALITASKLQHLKAVALLDLVKWYDESYKKEWRERLTKASDNKILFPSNFEELKEILLS